MNIVSFDIEEWYIEKKFNGDRQEKYKEYDRYLDEILDSLDENKQKATFFCVGKIAVDFPYVIRKIVERGHDIGCHSNEHTWLTHMTPEELKRDTYDALSALQDVCGRKVIDFRAPAFSIGESNKWAFEILAECGIERDSSIYPARRDFGGFDSFPSETPVIINYNGVKLKEFPICLTHILGKDLAYSGGGYFRLFPYSYIKQKLRTSPYSIVYLHIGDLLYHKFKIMSRSDYETYFKENGCFINRLKRGVKSSLGTKSAFDKMKKSLSEFKFVNLGTADKFIEWNNIETIKL